MASTGDRQRILDRAREVWRGRLIDLTRHNQLLYFKPLRVGTIELTHEATEALRRLLAGSEVPLARLAAGLPASTADSVDRRFTEIRRKAIENEEERGLRTLYLAIGMATWTAADGGRDVSAPVVLVPIERTEDRQGIVLRRCGDPEPNLAMLHVLESDFGCSSTGDILDDLDPNENAESYPSRVFDVLRQVASRVPGFQLVERSVIGNFSFQKMAMVRDLDTLAAQMAENLVVSAMAGDREAAAQLSRASEPIDPTALDRRPPDDEFGVLPADSSQQVVIAHVVRGDSGVIVGPPGTGKSQTISNLIAELAARGKSVLFVAEKRAALDAVKKRVVGAGLGHLVLDLHGSVTKKEIMRQFGEGIGAVESATAVDAAGLHAAFEHSRATLNAHDARMHTPLEPMGLTLFELQGRLVTAPDETQTGVVWTGAEFTRLTRPGIDAAAASLRELSGISDLFLGQSRSVWSGARLTTATQAQEAVTIAGRLAGELLSDLAAKVATCVDELGLIQPAHVADVHAIASMAIRLDDTLSIYQRSLFDQDLATLAETLSPARMSIFARCGRQYRRAVKLARSLRTQPVKPSQLFDEILAASAVQREWSMRAPGRPPVSTPAGEGLKQALEAFMAGVRSLQVYTSLPDLLQMPLYEVGATLRPLAMDRLTPFRLARMCELTTGLQARGFGRLLAELQRRSVPADRWEQAFQRAIWDSTVRQAQIRDGSLAVFSGRVLDRDVLEFTQTDEKRTRMASARVRRAHAAAAVKVMNERVDQATLLRRQANLKMRHRSLRQVMAEAPDVAVAVKPCWMASPLSVSQLLGGGKAYFDVVIFDEASQVLPEDAVAALMRGRTAVVAGDPRQLPPTRFFASQTDDDAPPSDAPDDDVAGFESVLDLLAAVFRPWNLEWHYRSKDERLIAFSNEYIYNRRLITFPGPGLLTPVRHVVVSKTSGDADEESSAAEVEVVAGLVAEHARCEQEQATKRSLGVIAMGIKQARRIDARLEEMRRDDPVLDAFLSRDGDERFFVKNLERVQGDERHSIILSIGYGKDVSGRLPYRFGPLLNKGGERRLNVAITRASHEMTLVSSFDHLDMPPEKSRSEGVRLLRAYIEYMAGDGRSLVHEGTIPFEENAFEHDVAQALRSAGIDVLPQYGVSKYRIDMVTKHPTREGQLVLAVECDGASYHAAPTARDRDRLRQQHLEAIGWRFCRIWSTDWFLNRQAEVDRVVAAHRQRLRELDVAATGATGPRVLDNLVPLPSPSTPRRGQRPAVLRGQDIGLYSPAQLDALLRWIRSDGLLRTDAQLLQAAMEELGFQRRGSRIQAAVGAAIQRTRRSA